MSTRIKVPLAIRRLVESNNELLERYQATLTKSVVEANAEIMEMMGLYPTDGWRVDMSTMEYVQTPQVADAPSIVE